jgi:uncharacterized integral membrane protein
MQIYLVGALIIAFVVVVFAVQNAVPIAVKFVVWEFHGSQALILLLTFALGVIMSLLISIPAVIKRSLMISGQNRKIEELERTMQKRNEPERK